MLCVKDNHPKWHYYISSRILIHDDLLHHARMEWSVESMHWLLDMHFEEDWYRVEDKNIQQNLNILRKAAIRACLKNGNVHKSEGFFCGMQ